MFLLTPEIAWHETLPIYSCDLQPIPELRKWLNQAINSTDTKPRQPLGELPIPQNPKEAETTIDPSIPPFPLPSDKDVTEDDVVWSRLATSGGDHVIRLWRVELNYIPSSEQKDGSKSFLKGFTFISSLKKHDKPVNVVRWSNSGRYLASGSDDSTILIWMQKPFEPAIGQAKVGETNEEEIKELWVPIRALRRHLEDVFDLSWSPDDKHLMSGSVDCSVIIWNDLNLEQNENVGLQTHKNATVMRDAKHYIQGVSWDPFSNYFATLSCDRHLRLYSIAQKTLTNLVAKTSSKVSLFQDDSWKSFFRRLSFSPDGLLLMTPSGYLENAKFAGNLDPKNETNSVKTDASEGPSATKCPQHAAHLFLRSKLTEPIVSYPTGVHPVICVRFCNQPFTLRKSSTQTSDRLNKLIDLPYRWVFCLVLEDGLLLCDTQFTIPFAFVSSIHYQALNDATWSDNGRLLVTCSTDGYCSLIYFAHEEIGIPYTHGQLGMAVVRITASVPDAPSCNNPDTSLIINMSSTRNDELSEILESDTTAALVTDNSDLQMSLANNSNASIIIAAKGKRPDAGNTSIDSFFIPKENANPKTDNKMDLNESSNKSKSDIDDANCINNNVGNLDAQISNVQINRAGTQKRRVSLITLPQ